MANTNGSGLPTNLSTNVPPPGPPPSSFSALVKLLPISAAILLTNGLVFALFASKKKLRTPSNLLLFSLAVVDLLTGVLCIPLMVSLLELGPQMPEGLGRSVSILHNFFAVAAAYHILAVTAEKYFAITRPLKHRLVTKTTVSRALAGVWSIAAVVALLPFSWYQRPSRPVAPTLRLAHAIFCAVMVFVVPYSFVIYMQIQTFRTATRTVASGLCAVASRAHARIANQRKCLYIFAAMATIFAMCWLPWFSLVIFFSLGGVSSDGAEKCAEIFLVVRYLTSFINPLLYTFLKRDFLFAFQELVGLRKKGLARRGTSSETIRDSRRKLVPPRRPRKTNDDANESNTLESESGV